MRDYISKARELIDQIWSDKEVNIISKNHSVNRRKFDLIDISLRGSKQQIEEKYSRSIFYRSNIRQTNTIIENQKNKYSEFVRKGIPYIFTIKLEHIHYMLCKKYDLAKNQKNIAHIIFQGLLQVNAGVSAALNQQKKVELIKVEIVRGTTIQVSYNYEYDAWIICSDSVSVLAHNVEDLRIYGKQRYEGVIKIGHIWFELIKKLSIKQINELKKLLNGYTLAGKYNNLNERQQLIRFSQQLKWFAIVDNYSNEFCMNPFRAKKELEVFGFGFANMKSISLISSGQKFYSALQKLHLKTTQSGLDDEQFGMQGSIVYFAMNQPMKKGEQKVVGAGKINTLQFQFLMRIQQKALNYNICQKSDKSYHPILQEYVKQIEKQQKQNFSNAPYPLRYYENIFQKCFELITFGQISNGFIKNKFATLLKIVFYSIYKKISLNKYAVHMLGDSQFISKIKDIPFHQYGGLGCRMKIVYIVAGLPGFFKTYLAKQLSLHFNKLSLPFRIFSIESINGNLERQQYIKEICENGDKNKAIEHIYLDGSFDSQTIFNIVKELKKRDSQDKYLKFILIKDLTNRYFSCHDQNLYPFDIKTIVLSYYGQHTRKNNTNHLTVEQRIKNLMIVTEKLKKYANYNELKGRLNIQEYYFPFSKTTKIENIEQLSLLIKQILKANDQKLKEFLYVKLITKLEQIKNIQFLTEQQMTNQTQHLIKSSYPIIPTICFKKITKQQH